jgi:NAD(P)-dependent dehydrogenase (short-subunit alcohol dehydrogenase family)
VARPRHRTGPLAGRVVVVSADALDAAHALAREGAAVVILGGDGPAAGAAAPAIAQSGGGAAVFAGDLRRDADRAALAEMVDELFASRTEPGTLEAD